MRRILIPLIFTCAALSAAYAADPAPKPDAGAEHPPTNRMDQATPTMTAPDGQAQHPPTNRVGEAVPPMKSTDAQKDGDTAAQGPSVRSIFSMEDARKHLMQLGYTSVSELVKDPDGKWVGSAVKEGKTIVVAVDVKGEVTSE